ncbi:restriction endonuclease [Kitasatospora sp. NPDC094016]|uniref:restriction endonuclease n=1 Tax=Kitasatospora sp. NPDC094016 TaxID=3154986 RepID=UPI003322D4A9
MAGGSARPKRQPDYAAQARRAETEQRRLQQQAERERKATEARAKQAEREQRAAYAVARAQEAVDLTSVAEDDTEKLRTLLIRSVRHAARLSFSALRQQFTPTPFVPGKLDRAVAAPRWEDFEPPARTGLLASLGFASRRYDAEVEESRQRFDRALGEHARADKRRVAKLTERRAAHDSKVREAGERVREFNAALAERESAYRAGDVEAVEWFVDQVLAASVYPLGFPKRHQVSYQADTGDLLVQLDLPLEDVVPAARSFKYVKTRDEIVPVPRPEKERKELYASVLAQSALRTLHEVFAADPDRVIRSIALNCHVDTIDRATGRSVHPCLITLQASREEFEALVLTQVEPRLCLQRLRALVSPNPYELEPVRPLVTFDLSKFKLMDSMDVVAGLDSRPVLIDLSPLEFEHLVRQLFEAIGMEGWNTQPSKDEGVDAIVMNTDPVMKGLCVIQAKRSRNVVPFETVSALAGVVEHKRAAKGILVTTSWFGRASQAFAQDHGRLELLDGANLVHLFKEHLNLDVIPGPVPPKRRA